MDEGNAVMMVYDQLQDPQKKFYLFWSNHDYELIKNDKRLRKKYSKVI